MENESEPFASVNCCKIGVDMVVSYPDGRVIARHFPWNDVIALVEEAPDHEGHRDNLEGLIFGATQAYDRKMVGEEPVGEQPVAQK